MIVLAGLDEPRMSIQSMSVDRIDIPHSTIHISVLIAVENDNRIDAVLSSIEGTVSSGGTVLDEFLIEEAVEIPAYTNLTIPFKVLVRDAPLPLQDPILTVKGTARVRAWIEGITYHFEYFIPLTHSPDLDNQAPVADIDAPRFARRDRGVIFDGSNSYDPDGKVVGWVWDFGDGYRAEGPVADHSFMTAGVHEVSLTVVDQMGERGSTMVEIRVLPV